MQLKDHFLTELKSESLSTRKMLSRVPFDDTTWAPHEKSTPLTTLAMHVARIPEWVPLLLNHDDVDLTVSPFAPYPEINNAEQLTAYFDQSMAHAQETLETTNDEDLAKPVTLRRGDHILFTMPKADAIRRMANNHAIHHRGQLSVYLRLLDVPVPGMYGPSADEIAARTAAAAK